MDDAGERGNGPGDVHVNRGRDRQPVVERASSLAEDVGVSPARTETRRGGGGTAAGPHAAFPGAAGM
jgi:hypothetical protein